MAGGAGASAAASHPIIHTPDRAGRSESGTRDRHLGKEAAAARGAIILLPDRALSSYRSRYRAAALPVPACHPPSPCAPSGACGLQTGGRRRSRHWQVHSALRRAPASTSFCAPGVRRGQVDLRRLHTGRFGTRSHRTGLSEIWLLCSIVCAASSAGSQGARYQLRARGIVRAPHSDLDGRALHRAPWLN